MRAAADSTPAVLVAVLDGPARADLRAIADTVDVPAGAVLLRQRTPGRVAFLPQQGQVGINVRLPGGETPALASLPAGEVIGETALLARGVCTATARAATPVRALYLAREDFRMLVARRGTPPPPGWRICWCTASAAG